MGLTGVAKILVGLGVPETKAEKFVAIVKEAALILGAAAALLSTFANK